MKRLFVILLILCSWVAYPMLHAQVYTTSSATYHSIGTSGIAAQPTTTFRSTSNYARGGSAVQTTSSVSYSTAPMRMANGTITTVASQLKGGLAEGTDTYTGYIPTRPQRVPGVPDTLPIGDGWDVALLLAILCVGYVVWKYMLVRRSNN